MEQAVHSYQFKSHTELFQNKTWKPIFLNTYIDFYTCFTGDTETGTALHKNILLLLLLYRLNGREWTYILVIASYYIILQMKSVKKLLNLEVQQISSWMREVDKINS